MRTRRLTLTLVLAAALVAAATALAQGPRVQSPPNAARAGVGPQRGFGALLAGGAHSDLAALLGISEDALTAERVAGKTVADILVEHGLTTAGASAELLAARDARIDALASAGKIDAQQAAAMKARSEAAVAALITRDPGPRAGAAWNGDGPAFGRGMSAGPRGGARAQAMGMRAYGMQQAGFGRQQSAGRMGGYGAGYGPGTGIHAPGTGFQPGYRFAPPQQ